jgi:hypothetical protein
MRAFKLTEYDILSHTMDLSIIFGVIVFVVESSLEWAIPKLRAITFQACLWFGFYCFYIALRVATIETLIITWEYYSISEIFGSHSIMAITLWTFCSILTASLTHTENELLCLFGVVGAIKASNHLQGQVDRISRNELASKLPKVDDLRLGGRCYEVALQYDCHHTVVETVQCQEHVMIDPIKDDKSAILQCCVSRHIVTSILSRIPF